MINAEKEYGEVFRTEFQDIQRVLSERRYLLDESYFLGVSDGIVIMAAHLGIALRPDLLEDVKE